MPVPTSTAGVPRRTASLLTGKAKDLYRIQPGGTRGEPASPRLRKTRFRGRKDEEYFPRKPYQRSHAGDRLYAAASLIRSFLTLIQLSWADAGRGCVLMKLSIGSAVRKTSPTVSLVIFAVFSLATETLNSLMY